MKALFLGAGASYECGMPLVWEFTNGLRENILKRLDSHLFDFRKEPTFRARFEAILSNPEFHYENMVGELEVLYLKQGQVSDVAYNAALQLVDCVQILLLEDQLNTTPLFAEKVKDYSGIKMLLAQHPCLHVFSLNHDINFEEICKYYEIPYRDGFFDYMAQRYSNIAQFKTLSKGQMDAGELNFFDPTSFGVNLIKLHGSLDMFAVEDKNLYLKCMPASSEGIGGHVHEIMRVEKHSRELCTEMQSRTVRELNVTDISGNLQFLRRSLLSGAHKFKGSFDQIAPLAFFREFMRRMEMVTELDVIGYGFGDAHINDVLVRWLGTPDVLLNIYDPYCHSVPPALSGFDGKVRILKFGLSGYFNQFNPSEESLFSCGRRMMLDAARENLRRRRLSLWQSNIEPTSK